MKIKSGSLDTDPDFFCVNTGPGDYLDVHLLVKRPGDHLDEQILNSLSNMYERITLDDKGIILMTYTLFIIKHVLFDYVRRPGDHLDIQINSFL
jgi:hypothetical protein